MFLTRCLSPQVTPGGPALALDPPSKSDPLEDLSLSLLAPPPAPRPSPALPPATRSSGSVPSSLSCAPALPPLPARSRSQEDARGSPNPFAPALALPGMNPFRAPPRDAEAEAAGPLEPAPFPLPQPAGFPGAASASPPRGWVTFEDEDFGGRARPRAAGPDSWGPWPGPSSGPGATSGDDGGPGTGVAPCAPPSRRPPPPPPPGAAPPANPFAAPDPAPDSTSTER